MDTRRWLASGAAVVIAGAAFSACGHAAASHDSSGAHHDRTDRESIRHDRLHRDRVHRDRNTIVGAPHYKPIVYAWAQYGGLRPKYSHRGRDGAPLGIGPVKRYPTPVLGIHGTVIQVATSNSDSYALTKSGAVYAMGAGAQGELGNGKHWRGSLRAVRVQFPAGVKIAHLSNPMPYDGGMAISDNGTVWAWGNDQNRQFCQPTAGMLLRPVKVPLSDVKLAVGALRHTIYYTHGKVLSCGVGPDGQLGNGTSGYGSDTGTPVQVKDLPHGRVKALTSSWGDAGVLMADGSYYDWGYNAAGQVGNGTTVNADTPVKVELPAPVRMVDQGGGFPINGQTIAVLRNGQVWEWGNGRFGQLGNGTHRNSLTPFHLAALDGKDVVAVASGGATTFAITAGNHLWAWGGNRWGEAGHGTRKLSYVHPVRDTIPMSQVSSTAHNVVGLGVGG